MRFAKYQALANDYLVVEASEAGVLTPPAVRRICDRHLGVGADGILVAEGMSLRIWNPDGSEAERSGNGLRIFARYLWDAGRVGDAPFDVETPGGKARCQVLDAGRAVAVSLGRADFRSTAIPVTGPPREVLEETLEVDGTALVFSAVTLGNPHCVLLRDAASEAEARALGPRIERDGRFPNRTNVQFCQVLARDRIRIEIWERGAGYTLASGTSGSAAAAVARRLGHVDPRVVVEMPGGELDVEIDDDFAVHLTGPVGRIADGTLAAEALEHLS